MISSAAAEIDMGELLLQSGKEIEQAIPRQRSSIVPTEMKTSLSAMDTSGKGEESGLVGDTSSDEGGSSSVSEDVRRG